MFIYLNLMPIRDQVVAQALASGISHMLDAKR
jgi:hypothetical protein